MKSRISAIAIFFIASLIGSAALAEPRTIDLGWGNLPQCETWEWNNNGLLGTPSLTIRKAEQRVYAYAVIDAPNVSGIQNDLQQCAVQGVAAAGLAAILSSPAGATPAFQAQFQSCMKSRAMGYFGLTLKTESKCM